MPQHTLVDESAFDAFYGLQLGGATDETADASLQIQPHHLQPTGVVHGGVYASIAEAIASFATNWHVTAVGQIALGMANTTNFLRPASAGRLEAKARLVHRGRTSWVRDVAICDDQGQACTVSRVTLATRGAPVPVRDSSALPGSAPSGAAHG